MMAKRLASRQGYATFRARLGYSTGPSLFYLTGGIGLVRLTNTISEGGQGSNSTSRTKPGLVVGAGMETMLGGNWSARIEYLDLRVGDVSTDGDPAEAVKVLFENRFHVFRYGLNYRFGGAAPALPAYNWSGFYAGVNAGVTLSQVGVTAPTAEDAVNVAAVSLMGGVHAGYNWQAAPNWFVQEWKAISGSWARTDTDRLERFRYRFWHKDRVVRHAAWSPRLQHGPGSALPHRRRSAR